MEGRRCRKSLLLKTSRRPTRERETSFDGSPLTGVPSTSSRSSRPYVMTSPPLSDDEIETELRYQNRLEPWGEVDHGTDQPVPPPSAVPLGKRPSPHVSDLGRNR